MFPGTRRPGAGRGRFRARTAPGRARRADRRRWGRTRPGRTRERGSGQAVRMDCRTPRTACIGSSTGTAGSCIRTSGSGRCRDRPVCSPCPTLLVYEPWVGLRRMYVEADVSADPVIDLSPDEHWVDPVVGARLTLGWRCHGAVHRGGPTQEVCPFLQVTSRSPPREYDPGKLRCPSVAGHPRHAWIRPERSWDDLSARRECPRKEPRRRSRRPTNGR
jgi:hypothetical protein